MSDERHADWTPHPVVEREIANEERVRRATRRWTLGLAIGALGLCPLVFATLLNGLMVGRELAGLTLAFLCAVGLACAAVVRTNRQSDRERRLRAEFRSEFASVGGWVVEITIFQGAAPTGRDWGAVWFEDDRLMFSGRRTSFALAAGQARASFVEHGTTHDLGSALSLPLNAWTAVGRVTIGFRFMPTDDPVAPVGREETTFLMAARGWLATGGSGGGQLPPLALGPDAPTGVVLLARAVLGTVYLAAVAAALLGLYLGGGWPGLIGVGSVLGALLLIWPRVWIPRRRWRAWRDRRRLERAQWKT